MRSLIVWIPMYIFPALPLLVGGCAVTGTYDDRAYLGDGVVYLDGNEIEDYTCGNRLMMCNPVTGITRQCRCVREGRLGAR